MTGRRRPAGCRAASAKPATARLPASMAGARALTRPKFPPSRLVEAFDQVVEPLITEITCLRSHELRLFHLVQRIYRFATGGELRTRVPSRLNLGRGNGHAVPGEGLFDSGEAVGQPPAVGAQAVPERYAHRLGDVGPHPRRQVIPYARYEMPPGSRFGRALLRLVSPYGWGRG